MDTELWFSIFEVVCGALAALALALYPDYLYNKKELSLFEANLRASFFRSTMSYSVAVLLVFFGVTNYLLELIEL